MLPTPLTRFDFSHDTEAQRHREGQAAGSAENPL